VASRASTLSLIRFGVFELDLQTGELRKAGVLLHLPPQPFKVLALLASRQGELVAREEIQQQIWGNETFVDFEHALNFAIKKIRDTLGDDAEHPRYIETLPRHGYRFIAPVEAVALPSPAATSVAAIYDRRPETASAARRYSVRPRALALAAAGLVALLAMLIALNVAGLRDRLLTALGARPTMAVPKIQSIAVLPLANLSHEPEQEYFADGMTDELITTLGKISALRVISRTSVMRYKGTKKPLPEIARELNVDAIVEGTVQRSGDRVRITANLLHAPSDRHLWAQTYERSLGDALTLEGEVARAIANEVKIKLTPEEHARPVNPEAHRLCLLGRFHWNKRTEEGLKTAIDYFQRAIEIDPAYAPAYAGIADSYLGLTDWGFLPPKEAVPRVKAAAQKALEIDGSLAEAHTSLAQACFEYDRGLGGMRGRVQARL
jgi:TolB-like protein/DNA-binding winged helix-turn-helix (wHTH) protein